MFGIDYSELLLIVIVAIVVIGPKDLPLALRTAGKWIGKVRRTSNHFRAGVEAMIREAEMEPTGAYPSPAPAEAPAAPTESPAILVDNPDDCSQVPGDGTAKPE